MHLTHTALFASDLERTRDFFTTYFDCTAGELYHNAANGFRSYFLFLSYFFLFYVIMFKIFSKKWNDYTGEEMIWK